MNNVMTPAIGSNQYLTKFDQAKKRKKFKVKFATKVKILTALLLIASLYANYRLLNNFMVFKCSAGGYAISKEKCAELEQNLSDSQELDRQIRENEMLKNNRDLQ